MSNGMSTVDVFQRVKESRKPNAKGGGGGCLSLDDGDAYPHLVAILSTLPKGAVKGAKCGRVGFYVYNGRLSVALNVPSMRTCGFYTLDGFTDAFARIENALREGKVDWREDA